MFFDAQFHWPSNSFWYEPNQIYTNARNSSAFGVWFDPNSEIALERINPSKPKQPAMFLCTTLNTWTWICDALSFSPRFVYLRFACYNFIHILTYHKQKKTVEVNAKTKFDTFIFVEMRECSCSFHFVFVWLLCIRLSSIAMACTTSLIFMLVFIV